MVAKLTGALPWLRQAESGAALDPPPGLEIAGTQPANEPDAMAREVERRNSLRQIKRSVARTA
jgi:hypothetical protein